MSDSIDVTTVSTTSETTEDTNDDNSMEYDFFTNDDSIEPDQEETTTEIQTEPVEVYQWRLGDHNNGVKNMNWSTISEELDFVEDEAPGLSDALTEAQEVAKSFEIGGFECGVCGLNHSHSDQKHDIRQAFNVADEFTTQMNFCPYCHCGVSELARLALYFPEVEGTFMFDDQAEFEAVREIDTEIVREVYSIMNEMTVQEAEELYGMNNVTGNRARKLNMTEAIEAYSIEDNSIGVAVPHSAYDDLRAFYERVDRIQSAADGAPIPSETEQSLNESLGQL